MITSSLTWDNQSTIGLAVPSSGTAVPNSGTYVPTPGVCPHCGYCPHCGRGGYVTWPWQPWPHPFYPSYPAYPVPYGWPSSYTVDTTSSSS